MHAPLHTLLAAAVLASAAPAFGQITFYEHEGFRGTVHTTRGALDNFAGWGFNARASSVVVEKGRWEVCEEIGFRGRCAVLRPGSYDRLSTMGLNDRLSSVRPAKAGAASASEPPPPMRRPNYDYRQRPSERVFEVPVSSAHAVLGPPERRCWVERQVEFIQAGAGRLVLSHQLGGSSVRRCETDRDDTPAYWDVGYSYRGVAHHIQMSEFPGPTITVNRDGQPRL